MVIAERVEPMTARERTRDGSVREFRTMGHLVNEFFECQLVHTKGRWRGKPFQLLPHQKRRNLRLFEVVPDPVVGWRRRYRWALIMEPKKNGKTEWAAGIACYALFADDEESPEIACGANSDDQAKLVFGAAKTMVELSAGSLAGQAGETTLADLAIPYQREIVLRDNPDAKITRVSSTVGSNDGKNLSMVVLDELHEAKGERGEGMWNVLTNATGAREQPLVVQISTAGWDLDTVCGRQYEHGKAIQAGETTDDTFYFECWEAPEGADYRSPETWKAANPAYGVTVQAEFYEDQIIRKSKPQFERYYLNRWTAGENPWIAAEMWDACKGTVKFLPDMPTWAAIDASTKNDSTGIIIFQQQDDNFVVEHRVWERPIDPRTSKPKEDWAIPFAEVENTLDAIWRERRPTIIGYDPAFVTWLAQSLRMSGVPMVEVPQSNQRMGRGTKALYDLVATGRLVHDGNLTLRRHMGNAVTEAIGKNAGGGERISKGEARRRIDLAVALVMCAYLAIGDEPVEEDPTPNIRVWGADEAA